jgi:hypothetical protein
VQQVNVVATTIQKDMVINITGVERSKRFAHRGGWAQCMISRYLRQLQMEHPRRKTYPNLVGSEAEGRLIEVCVPRQLERNPITINHAIEFMREAGKQADRLCVYRLLEHQKNSTEVHKTVLMEKELNKVSADGLEGYLKVIGVHLKRCFMTRDA